MRRSLLALGLLTVLLAGCVAPPDDLRAATSDGVPSTVRFDLNKTLTERVPFVAKDGVKLDVFSVRPDAGEKVPVIADVGPYYGNIGGTIEQLSAIDLRLAEYFVPRGYAVVRVSLRGTGASEGCFDLGGKAEQQDVHDVVEWLAKRPWSNGKVALLGKSYDGTTPWEAAITKPEGLATVVPISGITDMYRYTFHDGTTYPENVGFETYYPLLVDFDTDPFGQGFYGQDHAQQNLVRTCADIATQTAFGGQTILDGNHGTDFWKERDYEPRLAQVDVPVFLVHGLQDWNVKPDDGVPMFANLRAPKAAWLGQWNHDYPDINHYKPEWSRHDWNETLLVWFDHWLKGVDNEWATLQHVEYQDNLGAWRNATTWPPADANATTLHLTPKGTLALAPQEGTVAMTNDPRAQGYDPKAKTGGLAFATAPFARNVTLVGAPTLTVRASLDRPDANLVATLYDVGPDGSWTEWDHGARRMMHRATREQGTPVAPGEVFTTTLEMYAQATTFPAGHALGIALAPEAPAWAEPQPLGAGATYTLALGAQGAALHVLALDDGSAAALAAAAGGSSEPTAKGSLGILAG